jgi:hypothetical protein
LNGKDGHGLSWHHKEIRMAKKMGKAAAKARTETRKVYDKNLAKKVGFQGGSKGAVKQTGKSERSLARDYRRASAAGLGGRELSSAAASSGTREH